MAALPALDALNALEQKLYHFSVNAEAIEADSDDHHVFFDLFTQICDIVRSYDVDDPSVDEVVSKANQILNQAVKIAYKDLEIDCLPSLAHSTEFPVLKGPQREKNVFSHRMSGALRILEDYFARKGGKSKESEDPSLKPRFPNDWNITHRPHPLTTPLSRFEDVNAILRQPASSLCSALYDARCEITSDTVIQPSGRLSISPSCLAVTGTGGWKNRTPMLTYYLFDDTKPLNAHHARVGLSDLAFHSAIDESKKLIFVADRSRVKSYAWADAQSGKVFEDGFATHTLKCGNYDGPLHVPSSGRRLIRAGKGGAAVWDMDGLETHGPSGNERIGAEIDIFDSWRDETDNIEESAGSDSTTIISFADRQLAPAVWNAHPNTPAAMLCASDVDRSNGDCSVVSLDLEHGGKTVSRYLGASGETRAFSTSTGNANIFVTAASDGYARLYDCRTPLPVLTLRSGSGDDDCSGVIFVHPDGIPTVFTGSGHGQVIRLWDVRARKLVYELSTGNNAVVSMAWDEPRSCLYVSTACDYMDRMGDNFGYRRAKVTRRRRKGGETSEAEEDEEEEEEEEDEYDSDEYDYDGPCWPKNAAFAEDYFGHLFDAGDHCIFRYAFKDQPDPSILPRYGDARVDNDRYGW
ncbi:hypothetical protein R3P38DRAFT_2910941 [Favolaschia claudopus]|uniref:Uncharacterized protein n=1 Tax=Favolaschia claudopus TaxID=2862362 RepID=A0AAW0CCJ0_9AGAR